MKKNIALVERIRELCKINDNIRSITNLETSLGFGNGSIGKWAKSDKLPPYDRLAKVSNALGVSPEYLLTGETAKPIDPADIGPAKRALLEAVEDMDEEEMALLMSRIRAIKNSRL